jgi:hypothetical protein
MKSKYSLLIICSAFISFCKAQSVSPDVIASAGDFFSNSSGQIQWTLGELSIETYQNSSNMITQGFHQPFSLNTGLSAFSGAEPIIVYPNPATDILNIETPPAGNYIVSLMDVTGRIIKTEQTEKSDTIRLSLTGCSEGIYFVKIVNSDKNFIQYIRIIKS